MIRPSLAWIAAMAWRDSRKSMRRLLVFVSATSVGIAALVAGGSFRDNLQEAIRQQARPLLGGDLVVSDRRPFSPEEQDFLHSFSFERAQETRLTTLAVFPSAETSRLTELRAVEPGFPFYGDLKTAPPNAFSEVFNDRAVLLEESVLVEFGLKVGDEVQLGRASFRVVGSLALVPGEAFASVFAAPRAFISRAALQETGLLQEQSLAQHRMYFKIPTGDELEAALARVNAVADKHGWRVRTLADQERSLGRRARNAERFLNLSALVMLILGGIGVGSIMRAYARDKWPMAATLKCLGAPAWAAAGVFVFQSAILGLAGSLIGVGLGVALQAVLPKLVSHFVTVPIPFSFSVRAIGTGIAVGFSLSFLFTVAPLLALRNVPALAAFRFGYEPHRPAWKDPLMWACVLAIACILFSFSASQMPNKMVAVLVPVVLAGALLSLALLTRGALAWLRRHVPASIPFVWRQGLASLFRPNNQSTLLVPGLGLGAALLFVISFSHTSLLRHIAVSTDGERANLALIDVQPAEQARVAQLVDEAGSTVQETSPIVSMRLEKIRDRSVSDLREDKATKIPRWALNREYRSTYRDNLTPGEEIVKGRWPAPPRPDGYIPVSLEEELAENLGVSVGDRVVFNVQGVPMETVVASLRRVDWFQLRPNFFAVFPSGVLEEAPQFLVLLAHAESTAQVADIQKRVRGVFPSISIVDLRMFLETLESYLGKISFVLGFMSLFVVGTGLLVLCGALLSSRYERLREAALLRTLGSSRQEIHAIHLIEYGLIGLFSGAAGLVLGCLGAWAMAHSLFEIRFRPAWMNAPVGVLLLVFLTIVIGFLLGRGVLRNPPLQTLREEAG